MAVITAGEALAFMTRKVSHEQEHRPATGDLLLDLPDEVPPLVRVRRWAARALADLGRDHVVAEQLIVTEVLTNAYDHADLGVIDPKSVRGRGLVLVDELTADRGYTLRPEGGKTVWAVVDCSGYEWAPCV